MGKMNNFFGFHIYQSKDGSFINQAKYTRNLLERFGMTNNTKVKVPIVVGMRLSPSWDKPFVDLTTYRSMIGSLLYLTASRPDMTFDLYNCARCQSNQRQPHLNAVKNIFQYLKGIVSLRLWYPLKKGFFIQAFYDADMGRCQLDRKSTIGGCQLLDGKLVSWKSKKANLCFNFDC
ncbi:uncharacterized mitochondrial protein AtMg00810-like [Lactuca sativa]|uniref:uncharacterized mitochondrial protein AtMg00810-like n=1 Tax=Lactuca sativa TaxID=4236 RepID=UPI000CD82FE1|nr:uncharacterized mitochondrial protein AtMg00810-like [Lactuca sativa]